MYGTLKNLSALVKRVSFWLAFSLAGNVLVWLLVLNHRSSLSLDARQSLFGMKIPYAVSQGLLCLEMAGIPLFALMLPILVIIGLMRLRRHAAPAGVCKVCGYDLRATPARCPECGTVPDDRV